MVLRVAASRWMSGGGPLGGARVVSQRRPGSDVDPYRQFTESLDRLYTEAGRPTPARLAKQTPVKAKTLEGWLGVTEPRRIPRDVRGFGALVERLLIDSGTKSHLIEGKKASWEELRAKARQWRGSKRGMRSSQQESGEQLSAAFAQTEETSDTGRPWRGLHGDDESAAYVHPTGWSRLLALDHEARRAVSREVIPAEGGAALRLPRDFERRELLAAVLGDGHVVVTGESGVGKSALVLDIIEPAALDVNQRAIAVNLRQLPDNQLALAAHLDSPLEQLFGEHAASEWLFVVDGADAVAEGHGAVFAYLVRCAHDAGMRVVAVTAAENASVVSGMLTFDGVAPREHRVPGLTDDDVMIAARRFPGLQRLADDSRARELLKRPIIIDLLSRVSDLGLPLSESEALGHVWRHLVFNGGQPGGGAAGAREQVMLKLAAQAVSPGDIDEVAGSLDQTAVEGLRRTGLLQPASGLPWDLLPEFKHDLVRTYSIARYLLKSLDLSAALISAGTPRWTLPAARIACEIVLSAPEAPKHPRAGRFAALQIGFDQLATGGHSERWADVPTEALLALPGSEPLLDEAWTTMEPGMPPALTRTLRILDTRFRRAGQLAPEIAEPIVQRLVDQWQSYVSVVATSNLVRDWLRAHVARRTESGQSTRLSIRTAILKRCSEDARGSTRLERRRASEWISPLEVELLALSGPDLGADAAVLLACIAADEPESIGPVIEADCVAESLASYDPRLLVELADAYYIDTDGFGSLSPLEDGIRDHTIGVSPFPAFDRGPFVAMLRSDYRGGVGLVNAMLNHAVEHRMLKDVALQRDSVDEEERSSRHPLSITGAEKLYIGDEAVWRWYRNTAVGPVPCISALQALEYVTEERVRAGVGIAEITSILLEDAESLAMLALVFGMLVRHLELVGETIEPFLSEPLVWEMENQRVGHESSGLAAQVPELSNLDRRTWSLWQVAAYLTHGVSEGRSRQLKLLGEQLLARAIARIDDPSTQQGREQLAIGQKRAAALDSGRYEAVQAGGLIWWRPIVDRALDDVFETSDADLRRVNDVVGLTVRHAHARAQNGGRAPDMSAEDLAADLVSARDLLTNPPRAVMIPTADGPVAVAATAIELALTGRTDVSVEDLQWSVRTVLGVAEHIAAHPTDGWDDSFFSQGVDRSAAGVLPYLLLPEAIDLRRAVGINSSERVQKFNDVIATVASWAADEARLFLAQALDVIWSTPCDPDHLDGRCHHQVAIEIVQESCADSIVVSTGEGTDRHERRLARLGSPVIESLDNADAETILVARLTPAIRAVGSAAVGSVCHQDEIRKMLDVLLSAHQRARLAGGLNRRRGRWDTLVAARAAVRQAFDENGETILDFVQRYLNDGELLAESLMAIAAAAGENSTIGRNVSRLWPDLMDRILDAAQNDSGILSKRGWKEVAPYLIPDRSPGLGYATSENEIISSNWTNLLGWSAQVERWLEVTPCTSNSLDRLVSAIMQLDGPDQAETGMIWVERLLDRCAAIRAQSHALPSWLRERRDDLSTEDQTRRWQRMVDMLLVAGDRRVAALAD
ncbi:MULTISPECIES: hypothetical protein [Nocardia]|uniref:ATP-binding protein n=1 Tax=Nocardia sputorum TaxID=2984338 RepID=A0ABN6U6Z7_9NOCA|nr:hypothetical protein [Nocardia sputorum]BDU01018.1 hypothetical protein IFM12276_40460 [Nocardia sputorum]